MVHIEKFSFRKHFAALCAIEQRVWEFGERGESTLKVRLMAAGYALGCLKKSNRALVIKNGEEILGEILFSDGKKAPPAVRIGCTLADAALRLILRFMGFRFKYSYSHFEQQSQKYALKKIGKKFDCSLVLLVVDPKAQGLGIGRKLLNTACSELKSLGRKEAVLFTDNGCNYHFYDHIGFVRRFDENLTLQYGPKKDECAPIRFFVYSKKL